LRETGLVEEMRSDALKNNTIKVEGSELGSG